MTPPADPPADPPGDRPLFRMGFEARPEDIDELGHVSNIVWVRWIQEVAGAHWHAAADPAHVAALVWVVLRHEIDYARALMPGGRVTATSWVGDPGRGARLDRFMVFDGEDGTRHVAARTTWAMIDRASGRPMRVTAAVAGAFLP